MDRSNERMRLKDKIIDNISKAIKSIQELLYYQSKDQISAGTVTLCNSDRPCQKLCENLDHALLHGLKQVASGYWQVVRQLSHKEMVKEIDVLTNVTTDLGRGRAWLYVSLNEGLLESFFRMLCDNDKLLKKYYAKEALMLDGDRMNILLTHTSGLDCARFQLEYDLPYLDLNAYPPQSRTSSEAEDCLHSVSPIPPSFRSGSFRSGSEAATDSVESTSRPQSDSETASLASLDSQTHPEVCSHVRVSTTSTDSGLPADVVFTNSAKQPSVTPIETIINTRQRVNMSADSVSLCSVGSAGDPDRHQRLESIMPSGGDDEDDGGDSLQVIRIRNKKGSVNRSKKKKHLHSQRDSADKIDRALHSKPATNSHSDLFCIQAGKVSDGMGSDSKENDCLSACGGRKNSPAPDSDKSQGDSDSGSPSFPKFDSGIDICDMNASGDRSPASSNQSSDSGYSVLTSPLEKGSRSVQAEIESKIAGLCSVNTADSSLKRPESIERKPSISNESASLTVQHRNSGCSQTSGYIDDLKNTSSTLQNKMRPVDHQLPNSSTAILQNPDAEIIHSKTDFDAVKNAHPDKHNDQSKNKAVHDKGQDWLESSHEAEENFDVYSSNRPGAVKQIHDESNQSRASAGKSSAKAGSRLQDYMDFILQTPDSPPMDYKGRHEVPEKEPDLALSLDNNTKLHLMLDILTHEDEKLLKMYVTRENHTEGDSGVVYVLISDQCLYLLQYRHSSKKFVVRSSAMFQDLIVVSTGLNEQTLNIESRGKNRQKQRLWLTPGHQALTQAILQCLTDAVDTAVKYMVLKVPRFTIGSEVLQQTIALRRYISSELQCESQDVTICDYSLVFWEDSSSTNSQAQDAVFKEGVLLLRSQDPFKGYIWKPVYVVLKNSMLCISNKKSDPRPHCYLGLGGDQCVGCRLTSTSDRDNCVELILAQEGSWFLAAASQAEISEWRHALCLAVSQGSVDNSSLSACIPCCAVLSCNRLFLCHEDTDTKFYRTLGRAQLEDVSSIVVDDIDSTYCIIEFESQEPGVSSGQWVLYFSSALDLERYKTALSTSWSQIYQVELPVLPIDNIALQHHCISFSEQLKQQLTFR